MAVSIIMPKSGMAMEEGVVVKWLKNEGDTVEKGEPVLEVETDKTTMEVEADGSGILLKTLAEEGDTVPVTQVIGWIGEHGEALPEPAEPVQAEPAQPSVVGPPEASAPPAAFSPDDATQVTAAASNDGRVPASPAAKRIAAEQGLDLSSIDLAAPGRPLRVADVQSAVKASPLAKRIAARDGVDLDSLTGTGTRGRVMSKDVLAARERREDAPAAKAQRIPLTRIQKITGSRMLKSHLEIPAVTINAEADVTELLKMRSQINSEDGLHITINDLVLKAVARALVMNPRINSVLDEENHQLLVHSGVHIGVAVATPDGLYVPVVRSSESKSLSEVSSEMREFRERAAEGTLQSSDVTGGTFTVSNVGKYGITSFTPIINQPQAAILGVCAISERLVRKGDTIVDRKILGLSLTFDHRIADGVESAEFVHTLVALLEQPARILV